MLLGIPYSKFTVRKYENIYRGDDSFLQSWPDLSDPTLDLGFSLVVYEIDQFNTFLHKENCKVLRCFHVREKGNQGRVQGREWYFGPMYIVDT